MQIDDSTRPKVGIHDILHRMATSSKMRSILCWMRIYEHLKVIKIFYTILRDWAFDALSSDLHGQHTNWRDFIKIEQNSLFYARWVNYQIYIVFYTVNMSR